MRGIGLELLERRQGEFVVSNDERRLDLDLVHAFLSQRSYWAQGIPRAVLERAALNSACFGLYRSDGAGRERQIGFLRLVTDGATFAWVCDVFVVEEERGKGLAKWLVQVVRDHPGLQGLRRWILATRDAHGLYAQAGFVPLARPERFLERHDPDVYTR